MKKILTLIVTLMIISVAVKAQSPRFGFNSGIALANMIYKDDEDKETSDRKIGFTAGIMVDFPMRHNLSIQPGINFIQKGAKEKETEGSYSMEASMTVNYLEIPMNIIYKAPLKKGHLFMGAGPSAGFALNGKVKTKFSDGQNEDTDDEKIEIGNKDDDDLKPFELSMNVLGGYEFNSGIQIAFNYNRSLTNLWPGDNGSSVARNSYFGIKIGYLLKKRK